MAGSAGAKVYSSGGLASAVYPAASSGYVSGGLLATGGHLSSTGLHSGYVSSAYPSAGYVSSAAGHYGADSKYIAGNGLYSANGLYADNGLYANQGYLAGSGLRFELFFKLPQF